MPAGRPRKPTPLLKLQGTFREDRQGGRLESEPGIPTCPSSLSAGAKAVWRQLVKDLSKLGILAIADRTTMASYCEAYAEFVRLSKHVEANAPQIYETLAGQSLVRLKNAASDRASRLGILFGLSPVARAKLRAPDEKKTVSDKSKFFRSG